MAGVDIDSGKGKKRSVSSDLNMVPFIDLLMVTIAFLMITAVWTTSSQLPANLEVPGRSGCGEDCPEQPRSLHVSVEQEGFRVQWKEGKTVLSDRMVARHAVDVGDGAAVAYPDLVAALEEEWRARGVARPEATRADRAVLHVGDELPYREVAATLDAIAAVRREHGKHGRAAFDTTLAAN